MNANHSCTPACNHRCVSKLSETLKALREARGLSFTEVARAAGVSRQAVSKWETGESKNLRHDHLEKVCKLYNITIEQLISGSVDSSTPYPADDQNPAQVASEPSHSAAHPLYRKITGAFPSDVEEQFAQLPTAGQEYVLGAIRATLKTAIELYGTQSKQTAA